MALVPVGVLSVHPAAAFQPQTERAEQPHSLTHQKCISPAVEKGQLMWGLSKNACCYKMCVSTLAF